MYPHLHPPHSFWLSASSIEHRASSIVPTAIDPFHSTFDTDRSTGTGSQGIPQGKSFIASVYYHFDTIRSDVPSAEQCMAKDDLLDELRPAARPLVWGSRVIFVIAWCLLSSGHGAILSSLCTFGCPELD